MSGTEKLVKYFKKLVLDTSIIVEYIVARSPYRRFLGELLSRAETGDVELYVSPVTISEVFYISDRIYRMAGVRNPNREAHRFASWLYSKFSMVELDYDLLTMSAELKKILKMALLDCFVIASAKRVGGVALFKKAEKDMRNIIDGLRRHNVLFAEDLL